MASPSKKKHQQFDIVVIGRGVTALSTVWHLNQLGISNIALVGPPRQASDALSDACIQINEGLFDNISRITHQYGQGLAHSMLQLGAYGFDQLERMSFKFKIPWKSGVINRFAESEHESLEMMAAIRTLKVLGFSASLGASNTGKYSPLKFMQIDGLKSASTNVSAILAALEASLKSETVQEEASSLSATPESIIISTSTSDLECRMVVVAAHLNTGLLVPNLKQSLISYADQRISFFCQESEPKIPIGNLSMINHGQYSMCKGINDRFYITGGRFLRVNAGIEATTGEVMPEITTHLLSKATSWFGFRDFKAVESYGFLECRPCDELPIIGPMYGDSRVLIGVGFFGSGIAIGFAAGRILSEFIVTGKSNLFNIPSLTPNRLRSLT
ncbi:MAG: FAD-binding oxidoreductase [Proteobacteria bacterium]|nr:FAD-binding oxidoreductase [Pseudomonadota bacterium]